MTFATQNPFDNPDFRAELTLLLDQKLNPITEKVNSHETDINRSKGLIAGLGLVWGIVVLAANYLIERAMR